MADVTALALQYQAAKAAGEAQVDQLATTLAEGIGEMGEPNALASAYVMAQALDRVRLESLLVAALLSLANAKTGTILRARVQRGDDRG